MEERSMEMNKNNPSIGCKVEECRYHASDHEYCTLDKIMVGKHEHHATDNVNTDCESFNVK